MNELCLHHKERYQKLKTNRDGLDQLFQELADVLHPDRADFTTKRPAGESRFKNHYDGTPMRARQGLATAVDGLIKPKTSRWFFGGVQDDDLNNMDEVKRWFSVADERMWNAIYARQARFIQRTGEVDNDLVTFGTGILYIGENRNKDQLLFRSMHLKDCVIDENSDGVVDTLYYCMELSARQAKQKWGLENLGEKTREALEKNGGRDKDKKFKFLWCVYPREDRDPVRMDNQAMPWASLVIDWESDHKVEETGFEEFPFAVPRWATTTGALYGTSPGMMALPDANTLQAMGKTLLAAGELAANPPVWTVDDAVIGIIRTFPGGVTTVDAEAARNAGGNPFGVLELGKNLPLTLEMQNATRGQVEAAFFKNVFNLPVEGPQMTAFEVAERKEEFLRTIGPVFGQLEADYVGHITDRVFAILMRAGVFPEPPEALMGQEVKFSFQSPIQRARKQIEAMGFSNAVQIITPLVQFDPGIMDNFDGDKICRDLPEATGISRDWMRSEKDRDSMRKQRAEAQQEQAAMQQAQQVADVAATAKKALPDAA